MLKAYRKHIKERAALGIVPKPLNAEQALGLVELLKNPPAGEEEYLVNLITNRIPPGVDEAAYVKAGFLSAIAHGETTSPLIDKKQAVKLLGTMQGGYNIVTLVDLLNVTELAPIAATQLKHTLLMFDTFYEVAKKAKKGNEHAEAVIQSWADGEWFKNRPIMADMISLRVFKVNGETNTDDLSPATDAWSRPDIPLHALAMLKMAREGITPDEQGKIGPIKQIEKMRSQGFPIAYVGDVIGTGSSRKSATNSILWFFGEDIPYIPNKRTGGFCFGSKIAPIFYNTMKDSGALPIELNVTNINMGDVIDIYPYDGKVCKHGIDEVITKFEIKTTVILDEVRAGGRIQLIIGRSLTKKACTELGLPLSTIFKLPKNPAESSHGFTLAQKIVGNACGLAKNKGVRPGTYCEPKITTVGSQDTTGPMTRDELKDLACLGFSADMVIQSFCHTAAYPKPIDVTTHNTLPDFIMTRGGVSLRPGDGIIHSWLNRMLLPDTVGTGGDSHTRFPMGISFPAGSGLVAFSAATGVMPLDMPESILVRFKGKMQLGITLRDLVHAIPYYAIKAGLLTVEKKGKKNAFSGRILEIEGLSNLKLEQAFELSNASAERSAASCTIKLSKDSITEYLNSNMTLLRWMISTGYGDTRTLERRAQAMEAWIANHELMEADTDAEYAAILEIDLVKINEPILCAPNDPDNTCLLSSVAGEKIDEVFIGSCMTNIGHFRAAGKLLEQINSQLPTSLWLSPPTKLDAHQLTKEGYYRIYRQAGARIEIPGCSLCMGNQARVAQNSTVVSTSTRNFQNRLGDGANVYLASAELATVASILGRLPTVKEYMDYATKLNIIASDVYRYLNFDQITEFHKISANANIPLIQA
ncbi:bifunctional aconitate hydratase 2/2-methylisocitrate dehydratase [Candidatus Pseudomonas adelgestsugas]|uniref:Aconitate hydratase B n=1 Tax=Candidatus Pseudomonas adelgestsugas TaxID=1302376 RepID=A0ABX5R8V6_9PSED|nr:bifunctional aconitate hydratase 2/2-methylisocitrate dehydratase [Candidatus Pseudomonas adelgestsugas]QAX81949.1 Aconitate hydratase 2 [Candidatus Pseudomonas adelgestsugas]